MANETKTPGEVAHAAYEHAMVQVVESGSPVLWEQIRANRRPVWDKVAQAVREQALEEIKAVQDMGTGAVTSAIMEVRKVRDIRKVVMKWAGEAAVTPMDEQAQCEHMDAALTAIEKILGVPKPAMVGACAETAGAERSKSPPPAER